MSLESCATGTPRLCTILHDYSNPSFLAVGAWCALCASIRTAGSAAESDAVGPSQMPWICFARDNRVITNREKGSNITYSRN